MLGESILFNTSDNFSRFQEKPCRASRLRNCNVSKYPKIKEKNRYLCTAAHSARQQRMHAINQSKLEFQNKTCNRE